MSYGVPVFKVNKVLHEFLTNELRHERNCVLIKHLTESQNWVA